MNDKELNQEELQESIEEQETCDCGCEESTDDRFVELEISKEIMRLERETDAFEIIEFPEGQDEISKEICRDADAYANFYSRLVFAGVHSDTAGQLLNNYMTMRHNLEMSKIDAEKAKYMNVVQQQNSI